MGRFRLNLLIRIWLLALSTSKWKKNQIEFIILCCSLRSLFGLRAMLSISALDLAEYMFTNRSERLTDKRQFR